MCVGLYIHIVVCMGCHLVPKMLLPQKYIFLNQIESRCNCPETILMFMLAPPPPPPPTPDCILGFGRTRIKDNRSCDVFLTHLQYYYPKVYMVSLNYK